MSYESIPSLVKAKYEWLDRKRFNYLCAVEDMVKVYELLDARDRPLEGMIEIGSYAGASLYLLSHFLQENGIVISVDLGRCLHGKRKGKDHSHRLMRMVEYLGEIGYDAELFLGTSEKMLDEVRRAAHGKIIDLLHIDGGHDYHTVKFDFEYYSPMVASGGVVLIHDVLNDKCTVPKYWAELKEQYGDKAYVLDSGKDWPGMGVVEL